MQEGRVEQPGAELIGRFLGQRKGGDRLGLGGDNLGKAQQVWAPRPPLPTARAWGEVGRFGANLPPFVQGWRGLQGSRFGRVRP